MKSNSIIGVTRQSDGKLTFEAVGAGAFTFDPSLCHDAINEAARYQGFVTRISNGAALSKDQTTGASATPAEKRARMEAIARHLETSDTWAMRSAGGGGKRPFDVGAVVMGLIEAGLAADVDQANIQISVLATKREIDREAAAKVWASTEKVAVAMATIASRRVNVDADALVAEINNGA